MKPLLQFHLRLNLVLNRHSHVKVQSVELLLLRERKTFVHFKLCTRGRKNINNAGSMAKKTRFHGWNIAYLCPGCMNLFRWDVLFKRLQDVHDVEIAPSGFFLWKQREKKQSRNISICSTNNFGNLMDTLVLHLFHTLSCNFCQQQAKHSTTFASDFYAVNSRESWYSLSTPLLLHPKRREKLYFGRKQKFCAFHLFYSWKSFPPEKGLIWEAKILNSWYCLPKLFHLP